MLQMGEKQELNEGHQHKGDTSTATGSANCFHKGTVDALSGAKPKGWTQKAFFPPGSHQYAAIPDTTLLSLPGYAAPHPFCSFPSVLSLSLGAFHD